MAARAEESGVKKGSDRSVDPLRAERSGRRIRFVRRNFRNDRHRRQRDVSRPTAPRFRPSALRVAWSFRCRPLIHGDCRRGRAFHRQHLHRDGLGQRESENARSFCSTGSLSFTGNFVGAIATAVLMFYSTQYTFGDGAVGLVALNTAIAKASLDFIPAVMLGIMCNALVCLAVWMCYSARTTIDQDCHGHPAGGGIRGGRLRTLHREYLFHPDGIVHQSRCT